VKIPRGWVIYPGQWFFLREGRNIVEVCCAAGFSSPHVICRVSRLTPAVRRVVLWLVGYAIDNGSLPTRAQVEALPKPEVQDEPR